MNKELFFIGKKQLKVPIVQGGMGVGISLGRLAGTVAKEGGAGTISAAQIGFREPDFYENPIEANKRAIHKEMKKAREISPEGIVGFNLMVAMNDYETYVREVIAAGADFIVSGAGLPVDLPAYTKDSDIAIAPIVSTQKSVRVILKFWDKKYKRTADFIVIEGPMAGGHLGFHKDQLEEFTTELYAEEVKNIIAVVHKYEEKYEKKNYKFKVTGIYDYTGAVCVFMDRDQLNDTFDLGNDYYAGYFSNTKIKDIDEKYIGSVIDLEALTKVSRQMDVSMGSMMGLVNGFAVMIYMIVIYLLSKLIIEKNAQAISMTKILGYTNGEISRLYILSTMLVVIVELLISFPIEGIFMKEIFRAVMLDSFSGWITLWINPMIYVKMFVIGFLTYGVVALLEYHRIKKVPMDEALKNVE